MKRILILQFRTNPKTLEEERAAFEKVLAPLAVAITYMNAVLDDPRWDTPDVLLANVDGVILGGSGEFDFDGGRHESDEGRRTSHRIAEHMRPFLAYVENHDFPMLAICFGHQILGHCCGVAVCNDKVQAKVGTHDVCLTDAARHDPLFASLPERFAAQYGHKDSLSELPKNATLLARGEQCEYSALRFGKRRYSVQFHPELDADSAKQKLRSHPDYLPPGKTPDDLVKETPYASELLVNFVTQTITRS